MAVTQLEKSLLFRFCIFTMLQKRKKTFTQAGRAIGIISVSNMSAKIDIDAPKFLQNQEQMRLNIGKKLKAVSLNSRFTGSKMEECSSTCSLSKNFET